MNFSEEYFKSLHYSDYLSRRDRYLRLATELHELLDKLQLINKKSTILDYGCAVGFLMEGFSELGYKNIKGYDISKWATIQAKNKGLKMLSKIDKKYFDMIVCLDVLEHMSDQEIQRTFARFRSDIMIVRIPCSIDGKEFALDVSRKDKTHINGKDKPGWVKLLTQLGYDTILPINMLTIYDTPGVMCALCIKPGNHFFK